MRHVLAAASLLVVLAACSSSTDGDECPIVGTYAVTGASETGNTCPDSVNETTTYTISAVGSGYAVQLQGVQGSCDAQPVASCKIQGSCAVGVKDAKDPNAKGTLQFSWTFTPDGFKGSMSVAVPDAASVPGGCSGTSAQTGVRR